MERSKEQIQTLESARLFCQSHQPIYKGCKNKECHCTGECQEIIGWEKKDPNHKPYEGDPTPQERPDMIKIKELLDEHKKVTKDDKCLHNGCSMCNGTGRKEDGTSCIHMISCPCKRCNPYYW